MKDCHCMRAHVKCAKLRFSRWIMKVCTLLKEKVAARLLFIEIFFFIQFYFKVWHLSSISSFSVSIQNESWVRSEFGLSLELDLNSDWALNSIWIQIESWIRSEFRLSPELDLNFSVSIWIQIESWARSEFPQSRSRFRLRSWLDLKFLNLNSTQFYWQLFSFWLYHHGMSQSIRR